MCSDLVKAKWDPGRLLQVLAVCVMLALGMSAVCSVEDAHAAGDSLATASLMTQAGNSINTATSVALNASTSNALASSSSEDWYKVTLSSAGRFDLVFGNEYAKSGSWKVELYNAANERIWQGYPGASETVDNVVCTVGLPAGDFFVRVDNSSGAAGITYHFTPRFTASTAWETELNNSIATADPIPLATVAYGNLQTSGDEDWYQVTLPRSGMLQLTFGNEYANSGAWKVELYNAANKRIWQGYSKSSETVENAICALNVGAGSYFVRVDNSSGVAGITYHFTPRIVVSLSNAAISGLSNVTYTGAAFTPKPVVTIGATTLKRDADYTVSYKNNKNAGTATVVVTGKNDYIDEQSATFQISPAAISSATAARITAKTYTGKALKPNPTMTFNGSKLVKGTDYAISYKANKNAGTGKVTVKGKGNFAGSRAFTFTINKAQVSSSMLKAIGSRAYTGSAIKPTLTLKYKGKTLKRGTDYKVQYANNKAVGTAKVKVKGKGNFAGSFKAAFKIKKAKNTVSAKKTSKYYDASLMTDLLPKTQVFRLSAKSKWATNKLCFTKANAAGSKYITVSKTGRVEVKKGLPCGTYKVRVKVASAASKNYKSARKTVAVTIVVE